MKEETAIIAFLRAHERATDLIREEPRTAARIVAQVTGIVDEEYVLDCYRVSPKYCAALSPEYVASTMRFAPVLYELGYTSRTLTEEEIFDQPADRRRPPGTVALQYAAIREFKDNERASIKAETESL